MCFSSFLLLFYLTFTLFYISIRVHTTRGADGYRDWEMNGIGVHDVKESTFRKPSEWVKC